MLKYRVPHGSHPPLSPPPREQFCNRSCSNKTHTVLYGLSDSKLPRGTPRTSRFVPDFVRLRFGIHLHVCLLGLADDYVTTN